MNKLALFLAMAPMNKLALFLAMAWRQTGDKSLPKLVVVNIDQDLLHKMATLSHNDMNE